MGQEKGGVNSQHGTQALGSHASARGQASAHVPWNGRGGRELTAWHTGTWLARKCARATGRTQACHDWTVSGGHALTLVLCMHTQPHSLL